MPPFDAEKRVTFDGVVEPARFAALWNEEAPPAGDVPFFESGDAAGDGVVAFEVVEQPSVEVEVFEVSLDFSESHENRLNQP